MDNVQRATSNIKSRVTKLAAALAYPQSLISHIATAARRRKKESSVPTSYIGDERLEFFSRARSVTCDTRYTLPLFDMIHRYYAFSCNTLFFREPQECYRNSTEILFYFVFLVYYVCCMRTTGIKVFTLSFSGRNSSALYF